MMNEESRSTPNSYKLDLVSSSFFFATSGISVFYLLFENQRTAREEMGGGQ